MTDKHRYPQERADTVTCEGCHGTGTDPLGDLPCPVCAGYGRARNADSYPYYADWIADPKLPHGGVYAVRCATAVILKTGPYKKGWDEAQAIAKAMNAEARR